MSFPDTRKKKPVRLTWAAAWAVLGSVGVVAPPRRTFVDNFRTPHSDKIRVTERFRMTDGGKTMEVNVTVEDPDAFNEPWSAIKRYRRVTEPFAEEVCAENYHIPVAQKVDF